MSIPEFVTYSRNVFVPVTNICRNKCGYCGFRRNSDDPQAQLMSVDEIIPILKKGKVAGCTEALFTFGESAEDVPEYKNWLNEMGYRTTVDYVIELCKIAIDIGLLPHTNAGVLDKEQIKILKPYNASMGLMLETTSRLTAHDNSPGKLPETRIETIRSAGELKIPFTTGILVGIGETEDDRIKSLNKIKKLHEKYGHIQEVIIQNFTPKPGTSMENHPPPSTSTMLKTVSQARKILPDDVTVQIPPNLTDPYLLIQHGATDLGGISPTTIDWINPESEWPDIVELEKMIHCIPLKERLPIYPVYIEKGWHSEQLSGIINSLADDNGYRKT
ncbi:MAG: 7,8-didemethyl-8-hydroxy-5-deazariboflavin synthase subunit CofG [Methanohalobium sp.]|uniref:7,8-didemethyl-8-hydroxy-5-deazariboflavin synthase subunit CofG n=1 Tax=Methanohalobium sp. TaxID=2837493 RepID=UPI00397BC9B5